MPSNEFFKNNFLSNPLNNAMKLNSDTGKSYDLDGPLAAETLSRTGKFPIGAVITSASAATINHAPILAETIYQQAVAANMTINIDVTKAKVKDIVRYELANDGTQRTVTFGTGFKPVSTVVGTINTQIVVSFYFNGTVFQESGRTAAH